MAKIIEAGIIAKGKKFALIVGRFNDFISDRLLTGESFLTKMTELYSLTPFFSLIRIGKAWTASIIFKVP